MFTLSSNSFYDGFGFLDEIVSLIVDPELARIGFVAE